MIKIVAKAAVVSSKRDAYLEIARQLVAESRKEPGCISYGLYQDLSNPNILTFIEEWEDQAAIDFHNSTPHYTTLCPKLAEYRIGSMDLTRYQPVE